MATESPQPPRPHRLRRLALGLLAALGLIAVVLYFVNPGPPWSGETLDVDITSGHLRHRVYFLGITPVDHDENTWVSAAIDRSPAKGKSPDWQRVLTLGVRKEAPTQPPFHGAAMQIRTLDVSEHLGMWTPDAELAIAQGLLDRWQRGHSHAAARRFVDVIQEKTLDAAHSKTKLTGDDIHALQIDERS